MSQDLIQTSQHDEMSKMLNPMIAKRAKLLQIENNKFATELSGKCKSEKAFILPFPCSGMGGGGSFQFSN